VELPLVLLEQDLAKLIRGSVRTVQRLDRAGRLPDKLRIPGRPRWARDVVLMWLSGSGRYGRKTR
jgi:hypothetical protein